MALPEGKTQGEAKKIASQWRDKIWADRGYRDEDQRIRQLQSICIRMVGGDVEAGKQLAIDAVWAG